MRNKSILVLAMVVLFFGSVPSSFGTTASFQGLGDLPGSIFGSYAYGVSADGSVVVGDSYSASGREAFRWEAGEMAGLGALPGGVYFESYAHGVSADGSVVVGYDYSISGYLEGYYEAFRWKAGVMTGLGALPGGSLFHSMAYDVSADGSVVVGESCSALGNEAFRWKAGVMTGLGELTSGVHSMGRGVSADGSVVVGFGGSSSGFEAFRWEAGVMTGLGDLSGSYFWSEAYDVSADGSVVVGYAESTSGHEAFRWEGGVMTGLGNPSHGGIGGIWSEAYGVSADGSVVVGKASSALGHEAFIWDVENGNRSLKDVLVRDYGLDLTGWTLFSARDISDDGLTFVGFGTNPAGYTEGWVATIPEPATIFLLGLGAVVLRKRR
jgi:probable HAF family extracellular repeat protein